MARDATSYLSQLMALLPGGDAWSRTRQVGLGDLFTGMAAELARVEQRVRDLEEEADPRTAFETIDEWERDLGLPDPCTASATNLSARQVLAWRKYAYEGGQSRAFYIDLAASLGFEIEIHEFDPDVDDYDASLTPLITDGRWRFVWRVHVLNDTDYSVFRAGAGVAGDRLVEGGAVDLECIISSIRPAHTRVIFTYEGA